MPACRAPAFTAVVLTLAVVGLPAVGQAPDPRLVFFDDFAGPALNRAHWNAIVTGRVVNNEQQAYVDSSDTIAIVHGAEAAGAENGALALRPRFRPGFRTADGRSFDFISGRLESRGNVAFTHGTVAARLKLPAGAGLWPAFWLLGTGRWPDTGEIDVMENVGDPRWTNVALHGPGYSGNTPLVRRRPFPAAEDSTGWHIYAVEWTATGFAFSVDGDVFYRVTRPEVERYGRWAYDTPKFLILNVALGGQYPQSMNKVAAPYPGLAPSTVALLKAGTVEMLVDWVRVTSADRSARELSIGNLQ
jgi:beta-glucanase (GH16 family)